MRDSAAASAQYDRARKLFAGVLLTLSVTLFLLPLLFGSGVAETLTRYLAMTQDLPVVPLILAGALLRPAAIGGEWRREFVQPRVAVAGAIFAIIVSGWLGHELVFHGYDLSRDEQMAVFDQGIFANGRLFWPIAPEWRHLADALNRRFMLPIGDREFWVSAYLPMNAAFRALVGKIADPALASPLMAALGAYCSWRIARKLWPDSTNVALVVLLLFLSSSQVLITSMTAFSMTMHLGLNLLWLLLFVTDRRPSHLSAIAVGFVATGIHQPLFHPLFVLPFLLLLAKARRWRLLALYVGAYAAIGLFWLAWPKFISAQGVGPLTPVRCTTAVCMSGVGFVDRLLATLTSISVQNLFLTAANLVRFLCWQHPLLVPLALFGTISCWRAEPLARALAIGFVLPLIFMAIVLPWQGHGWGYRYLHPVLGNAVLLAGFGLHRLEQSRLSLRRPLFLSTALALLLLPAHALMASRIVLPFAEARARLTSVPAGAVLVDADHVPFGEDLVVNRFDLSNRPVLLISALVQPGDLPELCGRTTIAFYDAPQLAPIARLVGAAAPIALSAHQRELRAAAKAIGCSMASTQP